MTTAHRIILLLTLLLAPLAPAADTPWKIGVASIDITPPKPIPLAGYAGRYKPFSAVEQPIHAKALYFDDAAGGRALLITLDLVGIRPPVAEPVCQRITEKTGLQRNQILLNCSHTHSAPLLAYESDPNYPAQLPTAAETAAYTRRLQDQLVDLAAQAVANPRPAALSWSVGVATFVMNRREFTATQGVLNAPNPRGPVDRAVPVLRIENPADHKPFAILFGAACHNTTLQGNNLRLCGDYAGFAQHELEQAFPGATALFMQGCGGDANPYPRGTLALVKQHGHTLAEDVTRVLNDRKKLTPVRGPIKPVLDYVELPLRQTPRQEIEEIAKEGPSWLQFGAKTMAAKLAGGEKLPTDYRAPIAVWQFGNDLTLTAVSGEVVVDYVHMIEKAIGPVNLWPAGYCNDVFGYLPSARVIEEGGYENRGLNTGLGWFTPQAQDVVVNKVKELAAQAGRTAQPR